MRMETIMMSGFLALMFVSPAIVFYPATLPWLMATFWIWSAISTVELVRWLNR